MSASVKIPADIKKGSGWNPPRIDGLTLRGEMALLCRVLFLEGYNDHIAGHITVEQPDGTLLINPWELAWDEVRASDLVVIDKEGRKLSGRYNVTPAIDYHVELRRCRPDARVIIHNHTHYAMIWSACNRVPPIYDQSSALVPDDLPIVNDYGRGFNEPDAARLQAELVGDAGWALLAHHGVVVLGGSIAESYYKATTLEYRCKRAWEVETMGGGIAMSKEFALRWGSFQKRPDFYAQWWQAEMRRQYRMDPAILD